MKIGIIYHFAFLLSQKSIPFGSFVRIEHSLKYKYWEGGERNIEAGLG